MRILVDARPLADPLNGGVTRVAAGLIPAIIKAMPEAEFLFGTTGIKKPAMMDPHKHVTIPNKLFSALTVSGIASFDQILDSRTDLLFLLNIGFVGRPKVPYALVIHDVSFLIEPQWFCRKARWWHKAVHARRLIKEAAWLFAVSECTKQDVTDRLDISPDRITVIPLGLHPLQATNHQIPTLPHSSYFLALGASDPRKNIGCAIEAVRLLRQDPRFSHVSMVCAGSSSSTPDFCIPLHRPSDHALANLMKNAAAFLYPSWYEGYGLPLHEAAYFGTPCIASTAGALPETAPTGTLFAPPFKPHLWTLAIKMILDDPTNFRTSTMLAPWDKAGEIMAREMRKGPTEDIGRTLRRSLLVSHGIRIDLV